MGEDGMRSRTFVSIEVAPRVKGSKPVFQIESVRFDSDQGVLPGTRMHGGFHHALDSSEDGILWNSINEFVGKNDTVKLWDPEPDTSHRCYRVQRLPIQ